MRNINTISPWRFALESVFWYVLLLYLYGKLLFRPIELHTFQDSVQLYAKLTFALFLPGVFLTMGKRRNNVSLFVNTVGPFLLYFYLSYRHLMQMPLRIFLIAGWILAGCYLLFVLGLFLVESPPVSLFRCLFSGILSARTVFVTVFSLLFFFTLSKPVFGLPAVTPKPVDAPTAVTEEGATIAANMDTVLLLQESEWSNLNPDQRLAVMQTIADIEANYLGIPATVVRTDILPEYMLGNYTYPDNIVTLDSAFLADSDAHDVLKSLLHEVYHAYQHRLVELYNQLTPEHQDLILFSDAETYKQEFADYINGLEDYQSYAAQRCESDSNAHAASGVLDYYGRIEKYLAEQTP